MNLQDMEAQFLEIKAQIDEMRGAVKLLETEIEQINDTIDSYDEAEQHEVKMVREKYTELRKSGKEAAEAKQKEKEALDKSLVMVSGMFMVAETAVKAMSGMIEKDKVVNAVEEVLDDEESKSLVLGLLEIEQEPTEAEAVQQEAQAAAG